MFSFAKHIAFHKKPWYVIAAQAVAFSSISQCFTHLPSRRDSLVWRQCRGTRFDGQRCKRKIKADILCTNESDLYCHSHQLSFGTSSKVNHQESNISLDDPLLDGWDLWIDQRLNSSKRTRIKQEMSKPLSENDGPGYIYAYMLTHGPRVPTSRYAYFKIGRTIDPYRRMYQVSQRCKYTPEIIELFPHLPPRKPNSLVSLPKCPISHRVERLIHLELSVRFSTAGFQCRECGTAHREWFRVPRLQEKDGFRLSDQELWNKHIRPIILKWFQYGVAVSAMVNNSMGGSNGSTGSSSSSSSNGMS
ncbi:meiotically up-regulated gene 113-domain-containing protein [Phascolomyces articulosus]|uniref:Meiotically up-regulated gene 113-domain-containing protein n=1 Tax=Phascolomyces articulosus TaxID=60185 RepID=A0AAD5KDS8_9FUNG|nr:meiotically up-regulated gene 113-domain-containing protein [Phascolomyces articulosus]